LPEQEAPLDDRFDARLRAVPVTALHALVSRMAEAESFRGWWDGVRKPPEPVLRRIRDAVAAESAAESTRLAGGTNAPAEAGYAETVRSVFDGHEGMPPDEGRLLALHAGIFRHAAGGRPGAGRYKTAVVAAGSTDHRWVMEPVALRPPGPLLIPAQMETLTGWLMSRIGGGEFHPLLVCAAYLLELLAIRPFADGNGRVGRLLTNLLLLRCGHAYVPYGSLEKAIAGRWTEYYIALRKSQASRNLPRPDIAPWLLAFLETLLVQQRAVRETIGRLPDEGKLSANQAAVLALAARRGEVTNRAVTEELGLPRETAKQTLNRLTALGALRRLGAGRATRYRLPGT
jgi:Fic family protein